MKVMKNKNKNQLNQEMLKRIDNVYIFVYKHIYQGCCTNIPPPYPKIQNINA